MFRNQYDSDVTVWSPQGRLHQVDYAVEAMKQGSATVGIKSETHAVLVALMRAQNELCSHQKKIYEIDAHSGVSIAGLLSDGRILARFLQTECSSWRWDYSDPIPISALADSIQLKLQANTQYYGRRPFGVGLLVAGYDRDGPHIVQTDPSAEVVEMKAASIGARSQSARTYLERNADKYLGSSVDELIRHALIALRDTLPAEENLLKENTSIAIVGKGQPFKILNETENQAHLDGIANIARTTAQPDHGAGAGGAGQAGGQAPEPMQHRSPHQIYPSFGYLPSYACDLLSVDLSAYIVGYRVSNRLVPIQRESCYKFERQKKANFYAARRRCEDFSATLFVANSRDEFNYIMSHQAPQNDWTWVGLEKYQEDQEGTWVGGFGMYYKELPWLVKPYGNAANGWNSVSRCAGHWNPSSGVGQYVYWYPCNYEFYYICERNYGFIPPSPFSPMFPRINDRSRYFEPSPPFYPVK